MHGDRGSTHMCQTPWPLHWYFQCGECELLQVKSNTLLPHFKSDNNIKTIIIFGCNWHSIVASQILCTCPSHFYNNTNLIITDFYAQSVGCNVSCKHYSATSMQGCNFDWFELASMQPRPSRALHLLTDYVYCINTNVPLVKSNTKQTVSTNRKEGGMAIFIVTVTNIKVHS